MFVIKSTPTYMYPVQLELVGSDGKKNRHTFDAEFRRLGQAELDELIAKVSSREIDDQAFVARILVGWRGVADEAGAEIPFSESARDRVLDIFPTRPAVIDAFYESIRLAKQKN